MDEADMQTGKVAGEEALVIGLVQKNLQSFNWYGLCMFWLVLEQV
jgi:hypothetical protein